MLPVSWATQFLTAHNEFVKKVRRGEVSAPVHTMDYGVDSGNPTGVGASSLTRDVRQWWYQRKHYPNHDGPPDYKYTAEQGRLMEIPVMLALGEMGYSLSNEQVAVSTKNYGGFVDNLGTVEGKNGTEKLLVESKHVGAGRFLDVWYKGLMEAQDDWFWQAQAYLNGCDAEYSLFVVTAQDASSVRTQLTNDKRFNSKRGTWYDHSNLPNSKAFAFKLYKNAALHEYMDKRALAMLETLKSDTPPARERDIVKDWICRDDFCAFRGQCLLDGVGDKPIYKLPEVKLEKIWSKD